MKTPVLLCVVILVLAGSGKYRYNSIIIVNWYTIAKCPLFLTPRSIVRNPLFFVYICLLRTKWNFSIEPSSLSFGSSMVTLNKYNNCCSLRNRLFIVTINSLVREIRHSLINLPFEYMLIAGVILAIHLVDQLKFTFKSFFHSQKSWAEISFWAI